MISELLQNRQIEIHLQPIVSIRDNKIFAYEALTRAIDRYDEPISPLYLFEQANKEDMAAKLDEYVRELALVKFQSYLLEDSELLLFVKFDSSVIEKEQGMEFISTVYKYNIAPKNIVVTIKEEKVRETQLLKHFIDLYKKHGFLIAIDDFGARYGSLDRLEYFKPEIVKVDRSLLYNVQNNLISSQLLTAVANMAHGVGAVVIAQGIEHKDEVMTSLAKEIDLFEGYWFARPSEAFSDTVLAEVKDRMEYIARMYKDSICESIQIKRALIESLDKKMQEVVTTLESKGIESLETLDDFLYHNRKIEALYLIDSKSGVQIGKTLLHSEEKHLFKPAESGRNHLLSEYYFILKESLRKEYLTPPYVSKATGSICRTYSSEVTIAQKEYVICFDIVE